MTGRSNGTSVMAKREEISPKSVRRISFDVPLRGSVLAWSHDGQRVAVAGMLDRHVSVWDVATGERQPGPGEQAGGVHDLAFSPDGRYLAIVRAPAAARAGGAERYTVSLWDARSGAHVCNILEDAAEIPAISARSISFSHDGRFLAIAYAAGTMIYGLGPDGGSHRVSALEGNTLRCSFQPGAAVIACQHLGRHERTVLTRMVDGSVLQRIEGAADALAWSPDGRLLARMLGPRVTVFHVATGALLASVSNPAGVAFDSVAISADGRWLAAGWTGRVTVWDTKTWSESGVFTAPGASRSQISFGPHDAVLAAVGEHSLTIWDLPRPAARPVPTGYTPRPRRHARPARGGSPRSHAPVEAEELAEA